MTTPPGEHAPKENIISIPASTHPKTVDVMNSAAAPHSGDNEIDVAEIVAAAVTAVPGVAALHSGMFGEVGTYLPGRRVSGIRIDADTVEVHIVISYGVSITELAARVRSAVTTAIGPSAVHVHVEDVLPSPVQ